MINHNIKKGLTTTYEKTTTTSDAYTNNNTGALDYLVSTPSIMMMVIDTATEMLDILIPQEYITVGKKIELLHEHPSIVGDTITLKLTVEDVAGPLITLDIKAEDSKGVVSSGKYQRTIINKGRLLEIAYQRSPGLL
jgi:predicted thioesterase